MSSYKDQLIRFSSILKEKGYKMTPQRRAAFKVLVENQNKHLSIEELFEDIKEICSDIGLATVYRTMTLFEKIGVVDKYNFDDGMARYEFREEKDDHHHHHLICLKCNKVIQVEEDLLEEIEKKIQVNHHFSIIDHKVKFYGYCSECK